MTQRHTVKWLQEGGAAMIKAPQKGAEGAKRLKAFASKGGVRVDEEDPRLLEHHVRALLGV